MHDAAGEGRVFGQLLACLRPADGERPWPPDWTPVLERATRLGVAPLLWRGLKSAGPEIGPVRDALRRAHQEAAITNLRALGVLRRVLEALAAVGVDALPLKGGYLLEAVYHDVGARFMHDLDVLVRPADEDRAAEAMRGLGFVPDDAAGELHPPDHHLPRLRHSDSGVLLELHRHIVESLSGVRLDAEELWARSVPVTLAGTAALALAPEDLLLALCLHLANQNQFFGGLRPLCDVTAVLGHGAHAMDWPTVAERATRWGCRRGVYLCLRLAHDTLGASVPESALAGLRPQGFDETLCTDAITLLRGCHGGSAREAGVLARLWGQPAGGAGPAVPWARLRRLSMRRAFGVYLPLALGALLHRGRASHLVRARARVARWLSAP